MPSEVEWFTIVFFLPFKLEGSTYKIWFWALSCCLHDWLGVQKNISRATSNCYRLNNQEIIIRLWSLLLTTANIKKVRIEFIFQFQTIVGICERSHVRPGSSETVPCPCGSHDSPLWPRQSRRTHETGAGYQQTQPTPEVLLVNSSKTGAIKWKIVGFRQLKSVILHTLCCY